MPKDATGVVPSGALTRHPADWFSGSLYVGSYYTNPAPIGGDNFYLTVSLFNQDPAGRVAKVWAITTMDDGGGGYGFFYINGHQGTLVGTAPNVRPDYPPSLVQIYQQQSNVPFPGPSPYVPANPTFTLSTSGFDGNVVISPFPLAIVPVGWSLVGGNLGGGEQNSVTYWFTLSNQ